jgi:acetylornithine/LysW-gamma-L-lysine aminotransferase
MTDTMTLDEIIRLEHRYGSGLYPKQSLALVRGQGALVWDTVGRQYIDCISGPGVANVGHANPAVIQAVTEQMQKLTTCPNGFYNDQRALLLAELARIAPPGLERAYLCNSGAQVRPPEHGPDQGDRRHARLPRPHLRGALRHLAQTLPRAL